MDYKLPERIEDSNKSTYGRVLNIAGSDYMTGAAYLSSISALKVGCGYCFLCSTERVINAVAAQTPSVVFLSHDRLESFINSSVPNVVSIGCGLSQNEAAISIFRKLIEILPRHVPLIIDAGGLNILAKNSSDFISRNFEHVLLTPHPKEAARLLDCNLDEVLTDIEAAAFTISKKYNCITALKTSKTVVVTSDGKKYINNTGNCAMAKAGSGDVLTGMITGLVAQGKDLYEASVIGVYMHGLCGDFAAEQLTKYSVLPDDLISFIPNVFKYILN